MMAKISRIADISNLHNRCRRLLPGIALLAMVLMLQPLAANAQKKSDSGANDNSAAIKTLPPAYNDEMLRLAEILGALHYLRELCGANEKLLWRDQMANIIDKEEPSSKRKAELIGRFNRGFRTYQEIYRECTPTAIEAVNLYLRQGTKLAGEIPGRFGR